MVGGDKLPFGDGFVLDLESQRLLRDGREVPLRAKTFAVLCHLAGRTEALVTKEELFDAVWGGTVVTDTVLAASISELRKALEEDPRLPRHIHTVHRKGYRFFLFTTPPVQQERTDASVQPPVALAPEAGRLCGRSDELAALERELSHTATGGPRLAFVTGEAGDGKTSLVHAFLRRLAGTTEAPMVAVGQCLPEYDVGEPFLPVVEGLGRLLRSQVGDRVRKVLEERAPNWLALLDAKTSPSFVTPERMVRELAQAFEELTERRSLVLVLEDLHWSDPSTLGLLRAVSLGASAARLLVVATYRPVDAILGGRNVGDLRRDAVLRRRGCEIALEGLSASAVEEYYTQRYGDSALAALLARTVHARTEGIPLFLVALADDLEARGVLAHRDGRWSLHGSLAAVEAAIPQTVRDMIEQRMSVLSTQERSLLEVGAVCGESFAVALPAAVLDRTARSVDDCCLALARLNRFLVLDGEVRWPDGTASPRYRFVHRWYASVLYDALSPTHRRELHAAVAARMESAYAGQRHGMAELAMHLERAGQDRRSAEARLAAGRSLLRQSAGEEVIAHFERGLHVLTRDGLAAQDAELAVNLRAHLAMALLQSRGYAQPEVGTAYEALLELTRPGGDGLRHLQALTGLATFRFARAELSASLALMNEGIAMSRRLGLPALHCLGLRLFTAETMFYQGEIERAAAVIDEVANALADDRVAHRRSETLGLIDAGVYVRTIGGVISGTMGDPGAESLSQAAIGVAEDLGHVYSLVSAISFDCVRLTIERRWESIAVRIPRALALADEHGFAHWRWIGRMLLGNALAQDAASCAEGMRLVEEGFAQRRAMRAGIGRPFARMILGQACSAAGRIEQALEWTNQAMECVAAGEEKWQHADILITRAEVLRAADDRNADAAAALLTQARTIALAQRAGLFVRRAEAALAGLGRQPAA